MPAQNAIDRLFASEQKTNDYTVDEMLEEDDDMFLEGMSETVEQPTVQQDNDVSSIMDALCMSVIEDLTKENYKFMNFTKEQTMVILNYMRKKLGE